MKALGQLLNFSRHHAHIMTGMNTSQGVIRLLTYHLSMGYRCDNGRFWLSTHKCQVPTPTSQSQEVERPISIFGITKSTITNVSMLELTRQEQTKSSIAWKTKIHNS